MKKKILIILRSGQIGLFFFVKHFFILIYTRMWTERSALYPETIIRKLGGIWVPKIIHFFLALLFRLQFTSYVPLDLYCRLNMELDLQNLFGLHVYSCTHWLRHRKSPLPPHLGSYTRAPIYWSAKIDTYLCNPLGQKVLPSSHKRMDCSWFKKIGSNILKKWIILGFK
jgi:hypothetical protein